MTIMETWRNIIIDWINAVNFGGAPQLNYSETQEGLFYWLMKSLAIQGLDQAATQRLIKFIELYRSKCVSSGMHVGENIQGIYLRSLMLVNSSLLDGFNRFLLSKLDPGIKRDVDTYLSLILSSRDRISKELNDMIVEQTKDIVMKYNQCNPIDLSHRTLSANDKIKIENYDLINKENNLLKDKLTNCQLEKKNIAEHAIKLQTNLQQSLNELELIKDKCEAYENKYEKLSQYISTYATSIDSLNVMAKKLLMERNLLKHRVNELEEKLDNKISPSKIVETVENSNDRLAKTEIIDDKNSRIDKKNLLVLQVRLERLDEKYVNALMQKNNYKYINNNKKLSNHVAPMKAKRQRIHGRYCWKIVPGTRSQKKNILTIKKCVKNTVNNNRNDKNNNCPKKK